MPPSPQINVARSASSAEDADEVLLLLVVEETLLFVEV